MRNDLTNKWKPKGEFSMIVVGNNYYVVKFCNLEELNHVLVDGPWIIGKSYLMIRRWKPNFCSERIYLLGSGSLTCPWSISIMRYSVIGSKVGRVLKIDKTTSAVERGRFTRMSVEIDVTKPLLSKFIMNDRI
ncbi:hypothetical protein V2J09_020675 [Rumex salicifolius]